MHEREQLRKENALAQRTRELMIWLQVEPGQTVFGKVVDSKLILHKIKAAERDVKNLKGKLEGRTSVWQGMS